MFESLTDKLQNLFQQLGKKGRLSESDVTEAARQIRLALLEADVNYRVVKEFVSRVKEKAVGQEVLSGLNPAQQVVKIVRDELVELLGDNGGPLATAPKPPTGYLVVGLQGGGKTTTCGKLAAMLRKQGQRPLLVATDLARPAAIRQLQVVGEAVNVPVFQLGTKVTPVDVVRAAQTHARQEGFTHLIVDTAGRLHVNDELMDEVVAVRDALEPQETLLVLDAMTGQDAVNVAEQFNARLDITGFVLSKVDGDTRGGAALSIRQVTGKPIRFLGVGEKYDALEVFHSDRLVSRILGMGDVLSLIERAEATIDEDKAAKLEKKLRSRSFDLEDFAEQLDQVTKMGPLDQLMDMIPGMSQLKRMGPIEIDPKRLAHMRAMLSSMTAEERHHPEIIRGSRRRRIAAGSGTTVQDVNALLKQFDQMRELFGQFTGMEKGGKLGGKLGKLKLPFSF
ncbi:MAG TPA: signal recognition particle protein [Armatimonadota bacterium]|nr:signal recognition particle protein [Armatimonadota bacterium]